MSYLAVFKRVLPFFLTFSAGLLIASIFVPITAPNFNSGFNRRAKMREYRQLKLEVEQLRNENCRMERELQELREAHAEQMSPNCDSVPAFDLPVPPPAPPAPGAPRTVR